NVPEARDEVEQENPVVISATEEVPAGADETEPPADPGPAVDVQPVVVDEDRALQPASISAAAEVERLADALRRLVADDVSRAQQGQLVGVEEKENTATPDADAPVDTSDSAPTRGAPAADAVS